MQATEPKRQKVNASGRVGSSVWIVPELYAALEHLLIEMGLRERRKITLSEGFEMAIRSLLAPPRVLHNSLMTPEEQVLIDGVVDMFRNPRHDGERDCIAWLQSVIKRRKSS